MRAADVTAAAPAEREADGVPPGCECSCGEWRMDYLALDDEGNVECATCLDVYSVEDDGIVTCGPRLAAAHVRS